MNTPPTTTTREAVLEQLSALTEMQRGTLSEQYFERTPPGGKGTVRLGPYYKFQVWQDGRNHTRSVPPGEAPALREDIANFHLFEQLTAQLAQLNIEHTLALRGAETAAAAQATAEKKTSKPSASPKNTAKRSTSSPRPARSSPPGKGWKT